MSHLKKLSDRLIKKLVPEIRKISTIEDLRENNLELPTSSPISITKTMSEYCIPTLLMTASYNGLSSLSANQFNINLSAFVMHKSLENDKWFGYNSGIENYKVFINPKVTKVNDKLILGKEECPSVPNLVAFIERHQKITIEYLSIEGEYIEEELEEFNARVFMHENDHLEGILISSFSINYGLIEAKDPEKYHQLNNIIQEYKLKLEENINRLEDRYLTDKKFKETTDKHNNRREYFINKIVDEDFDGEFHAALAEVLINTH